MLTPQTQSNDTKLWQHAPIPAAPPIDNLLKFDILFGMYQI